MKPIASFTVNHLTLTPGIYVSRVDGDVVTYDLRTRTPNGSSYMDNRTMHSVEHMFATCIRNSEMADRVIYFGPMGCRTGFYLLMRCTEDDLAAFHEKVLACVKSVLRQIVEDEMVMYGQSARECGNYRELSLADAKTECARYLEILETKKNDFVYAE